VNSTGINHS